MRGYSMPQAWRPWALAALCSSLSWPVLAWPQPAGLPALEGAAAGGQSLTPLAPMIEAPGPLALAEAWRLALAANPMLEAAGFELQARDGGVLQAGLLPNPEFEMSVEDTQTRATRTRTLQLNQRIELGGKRAARVGAAEGAREIAVAELDMARLALRAAVRLAFVEVLLAQEQLSLAEDVHEVARRAADAAQRRVAAGKASPVEETRARVEQGGARVQLRQARSELDAARRRLAASWGGVEPRFTRAEGELALPELPTAESVRARLMSSPALSRAQADVRQRTAAVEVERSRRVPDVTVSVGTKRAEEVGRQQTLVGVSIPLPLFDRNQGNVREALSLAGKARSELRARQTGLALEAAQARERLDAARQQAQALREEVLPGARSAYQAARRGYELGKFAYLDVLDAQRTYVQAQFQYLRALGEAHRALADMDSVLGAAGPSQE